MAVVALALLGCREPGLQITGETVKLKRGESAPRRSALFDGERVRLRAARGETLGLQLLGPQAAGKAIRLELAGATVSGFEVELLEVAEPSTEYMYGPSRGRGAYPDILRPRAQPRGPALLDVAVAAATPPGEYAGRLTVGDRVIPVTLAVAPVTIDLAADPAAWIFYTPREIARVHGLPDDDGPAQRALEGRYADLVRAHGAYLATDLPPARFAVRRDQVRGAAYWPVRLDLASDERLAADLRAFRELFAGLPAKPFFIPVDEPHTDEQRRLVRRAGEAVARAGGGVLRAVTAAPHPIYDGFVDVYITARLFPRPVATAPAPAGAAAPRLWTYGGRPPGSGAAILDTDGVALRTWGWLAFRYDVELWYVWEGTYWSDRYNRGGPTDVMRDPLTFDQRRIGQTDWGNGDGVLIYPGPLPSLRLKALRRGLQDRLLLLRLRACGGDADGIARRLVPRGMGEAGPRRSWPVEEPPWEAARGEILDQLARRCPDGR